MAIWDTNTAEASWRVFSELISICVRRSAVAVEIISLLREKRKAAKMAIQNPKVATATNP
jgi:hypothetical protein